MSAPEAPDTYGAAWLALHKLYLRYARLVNDGTLRDAWTATNDAFYRTDAQGKRRASRDEGERAARAVATFAAACEAEAARREPPTADPDDERQELTSEDVHFIARRRAETEGTTPLRGVLADYWETGSEGAYWAVELDDREGYAALRVLQGGDLLVIHDASGEGVALALVLIEDMTSGWRPYHADAPWGLGQQACGPYWVHWIPKGYSPRQWWDVFSRHRGHRAEVYR